MRISMLEKRENFYQILTDTLTNWSEEKKVRSDSSTAFFVNRYLNFAASQTLPVSTFKTLVNEYNTSQSVWKRTIQKAYVNWAIGSITRQLFSHKKIRLPDCFSSYLILGGNHRLRLFKSDLGSSYVLLKNGENTKFITNEVILKNEMHPEYAPKIIKTGQHWLQEEYFDGKPLNRLTDENLKVSIVTQLTQNHIQSLLMPSVVYVPALDFLEIQKNKIESILNNKSVHIDPGIKKTIQSTFFSLSEKLSGIYAVPVAWSHGDFQSGNVLVSENTHKVIDWEAADKRIWLYDLFTLLGEIRTHANLEKAFSLFENQNQLWAKLEPLSVNWKTWLALEELVFTIYEDCSPNFYQSGIKASQLCHQIKTALSS